MSAKNYDELIEQAALYRPDTERAQLGFDTRLMARIRELRAGGNGSFFEIFAEWSWRSAFGLAPLAVGAAVLLIAVHGASLSLPEGSEDIVGYFASWIPVDLF